MANNDHQPPQNLGRQPGPRMHRPSYTDYMGDSKGNQSISSPPTSEAMDTSETLPYTVTNANEDQDSVKEEEPQRT